MLDYSSGIFSRVWFRTNWIGDVVPYTYIDRQFREDKKGVLVKSLIGMVPVGMITETKYMPRA
jgi:hypothetical protein